MPTIVRVEDLPNITQVTPGAFFYTSQSGTPFNCTFSQINGFLTGLSNNSASLAIISGLSGALNQTGTNLYNDILGLSGITNTNSTSITNINNTINTINNSISVISGQAGISSVNAETGAINLVGKGIVTITNNGQNIFISGSSGTAGVLPSNNFSTNIDWSLANTFYTTITNATVTFTFSNNVDGQTIVVKTAINTTGLINWPSNVKWPNSTIPISSTGASDVYTFVQINTGIYGTVIPNFSYP